MSLQINDNLVWYLRIVHSVDYYAGSMVNQEHQMPHRCGIITARPVKPDVIAVELEEGMPQNRYQQTLFTLWCGVS